MQTNGWIKEFSHITSRVHARNVGLQVFVDDYAAPGLDWRMLEELCVQRDAQTNTDEICLYVSPFFCDYIAGNPVLGNHAVDFIAVNDLNTKFLRDIIDNLTAIGVKATAQPERASHYPGRVELAYGEPIAQLV